jgi:hypothetical protein
VQFPRCGRCTAGVLHESSVCTFPAAPLHGKGRFAVVCVCAHAAPRFPRLAVRVLGKRRRRVASCGASPLIASRRVRARYEPKRARARPSHVSKARGAARKVARGCTTSAGCRRPPVAYPESPTRGDAPLSAGARSCSRTGRTRGSSLYFL